MHAMHMGAKVVYIFVHYRLKERIAELNSKWSIQPMPEGTVGVQQSFEEHLRMCLERLVSVLTLVCREITKEW